MKKNVLLVVILIVVVLSARDFINNYTAKPVFFEGQEVMILGKGEFSYRCFNVLVLDVPDECIVTTNPKPPKVGTTGFITSGGPTNSFFQPTEYYRVCDPHHVCGWFQEKSVRKVPKILPAINVEYIQTD